MLKGRDLDGGQQGDIANNQMIRSLHGKATDADLLGRLARRLKTIASHLAVTPYRSLVPGCWCGCGLVTGPSRWSW